jgi:hypothetical protein
MDVREIGWGGVVWIHLAQDRDCWQAVVNAVMNLRVVASRSQLVKHFFNITVKYFSFVFDPALDLCKSNYIVTNHYSFTARFLNFRNTLQS